MVIYDFGLCFKAVDKEITKEYLDNLNNKTQDGLAQKDITDHDRYILNHKLDVLKDIRI